MDLEERELVGLDKFARARSRPGERATWKVAPGLVRQGSPAEGRPRSRASGTGVPVAPAYAGEMRQVKNYAGLNLNVEVPHDASDGLGIRLDDQAYEIVCEAVMSLARQAPVSRPEGRRGIVMVDRQELEAALGFDPSPHIATMQANGIVVSSSRNGRFDVLTVNIAGGTPDHEPDKRSGDLEGK